MIIKSATFVISNTNSALCPAPEIPEYAFIGRSNVGKSSLINMLADHKGLAKTSQTPGKTRLINHFKINDEWYLVDLPGYGYAKISKTERKKWEQMIRGYLRHRQNLFCVFILVDIRVEPQKLDLDFLQWLGENQIPFSIVFTKADKQSATANNKALEKYKELLLETWEELPNIFVTSAEDQTGRDEVLGFIDEINKTEI